MVSISEHGTRAETGHRLQSSAATTVTSIPHLILAGMRLVRVGLHGHTSAIISYHILLLPWCCWGVGACIDDTLSWYNTPLSYIIGNPCILVITQCQVQILSPISISSHHHPELAHLKTLRSSTLQQIIQSTSDHHSPTFTMHAPPSHNPPLLPLHIRKLDDLPIILQPH